MKILIICKEEALHLVHTLKAHSFQVRSALGPDSALSLGWNPDVLLINILTPDIEAILGSIPPHTFVIFLTGFAEALQEDNHRIFQLATKTHQTHIFVKPLNIGELSELLKEIEIEKFAGGTGSFNFSLAATTTPEAGLHSGDWLSAG